MESESAPPRAALAGGSFRWVGIGLGVWIATSILGTWLLSRGDAVRGQGVDFIAFYTASRALATGQNPYEAAALEKFVPETGYEETLRKHTGGLRQMPYYYPVWFLFPLVPLLGLGFTLLRCLWSTWLFQAYLASTALVVGRSAGESWRLQFLAAGCMLFWLAALSFGQPVPILVLAALATLHCWDARRDFAAGACAAVLLAKPQLGLLPVLMLLAASWRQRRPWAAAGLVGVSAALAAAGMAFVPTWPLDFLAAPRRNPAATFGLAGFSTTLWEFLNTFVGFQGAAGTAAYALLALVGALLAMGLVQTAWDRRASLERLFAAAVLASFFLMPYIRFYDLPILILPAAHLMNRRPNSSAAAAFLVVWWLGLFLDEYSVSRWSASVPLLAMQMHYGWLALWTALWWLWDSSTWRVEPAEPRAGGAESAPPKTVPSAMVPPATA